MHLIQKLLYISACCLALNGCGGSSSGGSTNNGGGGGNVVVKVPDVNIGNMSALPVTGNQTSTSLVVTNNTNTNLRLTSGAINRNSIFTQINISSINSSGVYGEINVSQCATLQAGGTCSIAVTTPKASGNYLLTLNFVDSNNKSYTSSQVVVFTNTIPASNGFTYSNLNNNLYNSPGGSTTYVIPFVLDNDYTELYAYSNNPAFATSFSCPGGTTYSKGDLCSLYVRVSGLGNNPNVTATVTVSTNPNPTPPLNAETSKKINIKGSTGFQFSTPITVSNFVTGNIVSSAFNVVINPANGTAAQTVTLLNNGSATVSNIAITPVGGIISITNSGAGSCATGVGGANTLTPNSSCTFSVNANTGTSGSNTVNVTYNNGGTGNTTGITPFTVVYISATPGPGMSMTAGQGSLQNATIGSTSSLNILVANTGNVLLSNIGFTTMSTPFSYDSTSTCATNGTLSLPVGGSCTLVVDYTPTVVGSGTLTINQSASYTNQGGGTNSYQGSSFSTAYSSAVGNAFVYMTPNSVSYAIRADNSDTVIESIVVANFGGQSVTLSSPSYNESGFASISSSVHINDGCAGVTLPTNSASPCTITVTYGPVSATQSASGYLFVPYKPNPAASTANAFSAQNFQAESAALVTVTGPVKSGASGGTGSGSSGSPYTFYNSPITGKPIVLTYTYTNSGTVSASNFVVSLNNLPVGWILQSTSCGTGVTESTLAVGSPCTVAITAVGANSIYNPYSFTGAMNIVTPNFSYTDTNTGLNTGPASPATTYVTANLFATIGSSAPSGLSAESVESFNITFTSTAGDVSEYPVTITIPSTSLPQGAGSSAVYVTSSSVGGNQCTISSVTGNCTINLSNTASAVARTYSFPFWITPNTLTPGLSNSIVQNFGFTLN